MNSRERLVKALNHEEPDRIPIDLGGTDVTSICKGAYRDLMAYLGRNVAEPIRLVNVVEQLPELDDAFLDGFVRCDTRQIRENGPSNWQLEIVDDGDYWAFWNEWGIKLRMPKGHGHYFDIVARPLEEATLESLRHFVWPEATDPARWHGLRERAEHLYTTTEHALVVGCIFGGGVFEFPQYLRGIEGFLGDLAADVRFAEALMDRITDTLIAAYSCMLDQVGPFVQVVSVCDDLASQRGPMISPAMYRRLIKPRQAQLIHEIKRRTSAKVLYHICGAARTFLPDLIEIGVDILNPVQVSAEGMETQALKRDFGHDLVFWGGACDAHHTLPFGTPQEVRDEVKRHLEHLAPGGGFVFAPIHNIQDGVPPENIVAMLDTVHEFGRY